MIHWEEYIDKRGYLIWLRFVDCGHWGMILTGWLADYAFPPLLENTYWPLSRNWD